MELEELLRRWRRASLGSVGANPALRANKWRMSVSDTTPVNLPPSPPPGTEDGRLAAGGTKGAGGEAATGGGTATDGASLGVGGALDAGLGLSTIHILGIQLACIQAKNHRTNVLPVRLCSHKLCNRLGQRRVRVDVKDWIRILSVVESPIGKDNGDEMETAGFQKRNRA
jgi:hypothetical protein